MLQGEIFDVVVDIRRDSPEFGKAQCLTLRATEAQQLFIPRGYAHGFLMLSMEAIVYYKIDARYAVDYEQVLCWNDSQLDISWASVGRSRPIRFFRRKTPQAVPSTASRKMNYQP